MFRLTRLVSPAAMLALALMAGCERTATAPAPATTPSFNLGHTGDDGQLQAPNHRGGKKAGVFGKSGGQLHYVDSSAPGIEYWLDVPPGAVRASTTFTLEVLPGEHYLVSLEARAADGSNAGKAFGQPVRLTISYSTARHPAPPPHLYIANMPDGGGAAIPVKTQVNPGQKTATGYLPHFSKWSLIAN